MLRSENTAGSDHRAGTEFDPTATLAPTVRWTIWQNWSDHAPARSANARREVGLPVPHIT